MLQVQQKFACILSESVLGQVKMLQADPEVLRNNRELTEQAGMWAVSCSCRLFWADFFNGFGVQ